MDSEKSKFITFLLIALIFIGVSGYYYYQSNPLSFSTTSVTTRLKEMRAKAGSITKPNSVPQLPNEAGRITNDNCGLSFVIPQEWKISEAQDGTRYCHYEIDAPAERVGFLQIGVPGYLPRNKNSYDSFTWDEVINEVNSNTEGIQIDNITVSGVPGIRVIVPEVKPTETTLGGSPNVMYFFRKGESVFYVRYSILVDHYEEYNRYYNRQISVENYYHDIDPVLESLRFSKEDSFYDSPMTVGPK